MTTSWSGRRRSCATPARRSTGCWARSNAERRGVLAGSAGPGEDREVERGDEAGSGIADRGDRVDHPRCGAEDPSFVVVAVLASGFDLAGVGRGALDLDAVPGP